MLHYLFHLASTWQWHELRRTTIGLRNRFLAITLCDFTGFHGFIPSASAARAAGQVKLVNSDRQLGIVALNHPILTEVYDIGIKELQALKDQLIEDEGGAHSVNGSPSMGSRMGASGVQVV